MTPTRVTVISTLVALTPALAPGQSGSDAAAGLTVDQLKDLYLSCERGSLRGELDLGTVAGCSVVYEALKHRAFDGDFEKLLAWSRSQLRVQRPAHRSAL